MAKKYTIEGYRKALMSIADPKKLGKAIMTPLRKGQRDIGRYLKWHYWQHSLGSKVWKWRNEKWGRSGGPIVRVSMPRAPSGQRTRWSATQNAYIAPVFVSGLAGKIELGGNLRKHVMWGRASDARKGVMVSRKPAIDRIIDREWPQIVATVQTSFGREIEQLL